MTKPNYAKKLGITEAQVDELCKVAYATWQYIGCDVLQANDRKDMPRADVVEVVMDADHMLMNSTRMSPELKALLKAYSHSETIAKLLKEHVFTFSRYGM